MGINRGVNSAPARPPYISSSRATASASTSSQTTNWTWIGSTYRLTGTSGGIGLFLHQHARLEQLFTTVLAEFNPDVLHCVHLLHRSPSLLEIAVRHKLPIIIALQDFYFACPRVHLQKTSGQARRGARAGQECAADCFCL